MPDPTARPRLQLVPVVRLLAEHRVDWVLTGSAVLAAYGGRLIPNDLDVTPSLAPDNLLRLAGALRDLAAVPAFLPGWPAGPSLAQCRAWTPAAGDRAAPGPPVRHPARDGRRTPTLVWQL